jgi:branched-chain amino acid transport system permease protein
MVTVTSILDLLTVIISGFGSLVIVALGLGIIFGMMNIINLAHGEFMMVGAYTTAIAHAEGVPLFVCMLFGGVTAGVLGVIVERLVLQHLYDRPADSMVATWGLSLVLSQSALVVFGPTFSNIPTPFGAVTFGSYSASAYQLVLGVVAVVMLVALYALFYHTEYGLKARATMQDKETARSLGVDTRRIYMITFFVGSVATGIAGAVFAPIISIVPTLGQAFIIDAFVTVIVGGANVLIGVASGGASLSVINGAASQGFGSLAGRVALLITAIIVIRIYPNGLSDYIEGKVSWL